MNKTFLIIVAIILAGVAANFILANKSMMSDEPLQGNYGLYFSQVEKGKQPDPNHLDVHFCHFLGQAKSTLEMSAFDIDLPCVEKALMKAHENKVNVRIVTDSDNITPEIKSLRKAGITVVEDKKSAFMHNKFVVIDKKWVWTGSFNPTVNGARKNNNNALWFESKKLAENYLKEFNEMFNDHSFGARSPSNTPYPKLMLAGFKAENYFAPEDGVKEQIVAYLKTAKSSIHFMAFAFTDKEIGKLLKQKSKAGVDVHGVFEKMGAKSKYSMYKKLKRAKLDVAMDGNPRVMHHKVFIVDETSVLTGSYNFSKNADRSNDENILILHSPAIAKAFLKEFKSIYAQRKK